MSGTTEEGAGDQEDDQRRRRAMAVFLLVFVLLMLGGTLALGTVSFGGTGELTVTVSDQNDQAASGQEVQILDPNTGEVVATGITDEDGEVDFDLDQGDYDIVVNDKTQSVAVADDTNADVTVDTAPPEPNETAP